MEWGNEIALIRIDSHFHGNGNFIGMLMQSIRMVFFV